MMMVRRVAVATNDVCIAHLKRGEELVFVHPITVLLPDWYLSQRSATTLTANIDLLLSFSISKNDNMPNKLFAVRRFRGNYLFGGEERVWPVLANRLEQLRSEGLGPTWYDLPLQYLPIYRDEFFLLENHQEKRQKRSGWIIRKSNINLYLPQLGKIADSGEIQQIFLDDPMTEPKLRWVEKESFPQLIIRFDSASKRIISICYRGHQRETELAEFLICYEGNNIDIVENRKLPESIWRLPRSRR